MSSDEIYDPIREKKVKGFQEELVRQSLIALMVDSLGYPKHLITVEKDLNQLPHLKDKKTKNQRRADIICFEHNIHPLYELFPLLLIECKAEKLNQSHIDQVIGYNYFVQAFFIAVASNEKIKTLWYNKKKGQYDAVDFLPSHKELMQAVLHGK
jgi:hypothetical protein